MKPYKHFTIEERKCLQQFLSEGLSFRQIADLLERSPSTISREVIEINPSTNLKVKLTTNIGITTGVLKICILDADASKSVLF